VRTFAHFLDSSLLLFDVWAHNGNQRARVVLPSGRVAPWLAEAPVHHIFA